MWAYSLFRFRRHLACLDLEGRWPNREGGGSGSARILNSYLIIPKGLVQPNQHTGSPFLATSGLMPPQNIRGSDFPTLSIPRVTKGCSSPLTGLERTMHGTGRELVISQRATGCFAVLQKGKDLPPVLPLTLSYGQLYYRGGDDSYLMWGGHPFPFHWECAECRQGAEWKVQRGKQRAQESWDCRYSLALLGHPGRGEMGWWETCYPSCSSTRDGFPIV